MREQLLVEDHPVMVLLFHMEGCPACAAFLPVFSRVAAQHPGVPSLDVDCEDQPAAADYYEITMTPTTLLLRHGRVLRRLEGEGTRQNAERLFAMAEELRSRDVARALGAGPFFRRR